MSEDEQRQQLEAIQRQMTAQAAPAEAAAVPSGEAGEALTGFDETDPSTWGDPSRNAPCPCGSGKKFKHCHGALV